jgi:hypothetical protein
MTAGIGANQVIAQEPQQYSHRALHRLMASTGNPVDYQKLATYFHYQEQAYRAKAQAEMDAYADCVRNITLAPKFLTRADVTARLYDYYSYKADADAKLARRYDEMLIIHGIRPLSAPTGIVSVTSLEDASAGTREAATLR